MSCILLIFKWYLHYASFNINVIFHDLNASNVLLWSLSPDHVINCKVSGFTSITYSGPKGARGLSGTKGFIASEVSHINHSKEHCTYDHQADIFSFGMFLYQLFAHQHPFHNMQPSRIDIAIAETGL